MIQGRQPGAFIVFTTAHAHYAAEAFDNYPARITMRLEKFEEFRLVIEK